MVFAHHVIYQVSCPSHPSREAPPERTGFSHTIFNPSPPHAAFRPRLRQPFHDKIPPVIPLTPQHPYVGNLVGIIFLDRGPGASLIARGTGARSVKLGERASSISWARLWSPMRVPRAEGCPLSSTSIEQASGLQRGHPGLCKPAVF